MQADEIIQKLEWINLSEEEKFLISELASNEHEFYLLKRMMDISSEEVFDIPEVNPDVRKNILLSIKKKNSFKVWRNWYLAAASLVVFGFLTFLLFQNKTQNDLVKEENLNKKPAQNQSVIFSTNDSSKKAIVKSEISENNSIKEKFIINKKVIKNQNEKVDQSFAINHTIKLKNELPDLVGNYKSEETSKVQAATALQKKDIGMNVKVQTYASNNTVAHNKELLNFITEIF